MWDLIVSVPGHCLSFYSVLTLDKPQKVLKVLKTMKMSKPLVCWFLLHSHHVNISLLIKVSCISVIPSCILSIMFMNFIYKL